MTSILTTTQAALVIRRAALTLLTLVTLVMLTGCGPDINNGQMVDAGGENGQGGLAFVLLAVFIGLLFASLFYMDRIRQRREDRQDADRDGGAK
ncbi:MAG: hypothetical protein JHC94_00395 [Acidimicrobiia bacterium]|nr:hypothetical protein [Acidimicrobiia bacterium]MBJ7381512.1 hypothetical protein [Acidimicrobiia bacterium]MBJ7512761.1 hypothetical protein [Acidimicrobiia bacterium]